MSIVRMEIPGPVAQEIIRRHWESVAKSTNTIPLVVESAAGIYVRTPDGQTLIDLNSGVGVANVGFLNFEVRQAIMNVMGLKSQYISSDFHDERVVELAEAMQGLMQKHNPGEWRTFFCSSGTEAIEAAYIALKTSRPERSHFLCFEGAFHGRTIGARSFTASKAIQKRDLPSIPDIHRIPFPNKYACAAENYQPCTGRCMDEAEKRLFGTEIPTDRLNAIFMELVQGEGGINIISPRALEKIRLWRERYDLKIVVDEIQTGIGRTGEMFCFENSEYRFLRPDVVCLGKAIGGGYIPTGITVLRKEFDFKEFGEHSNTNGGNPLAMAAALKTIEIVNREGFLEHVRAMGSYFQRRLTEVASHFNREHHWGSFKLRWVRGLGLMIGVDVVRSGVDAGPNPEARAKLFDECLAYGIVPMTCGQGWPNSIQTSLRFMPPLIITRQQIDDAIERFEMALESAAG